MSQADELLLYAMVATDAVAAAVDLSHSTDEFKLIPKAELSKKAVTTDDHFTSYAHYMLKSTQSYWNTLGRYLHRDVPWPIGYTTRDLTNDWFQTLELKRLSLRRIKVEKLSYRVAKAVIMEEWTRFKLDYGIIHEVTYPGNKELIETPTEEYYDERCYTRSPFSRPDHALNAEARALEAETPDYTNLEHLRSDGWVDQI